MYCIKCGVELSDSEKKCPLCGTPVFNPAVDMPEGDPPYPRNRPVQTEEVNPSGLLFLVTMLFVLPTVICLLCDWRINGTLLWSGYVVGALLLVYVSAVLPCWFKKPNAVVFVPSGFGALALYLLFINFATGGHWFLSFALPVTAMAAALVTAVLALLKYVRGGYLFIFGGALIVSGGMSVLMEYFINITFHVHEAIFWSFYPLAAGLLLGATLLVIGICRPLRESLHKKFFL